MRPLPWILVALAVSATAAWPLPAAPGQITGVVTDPDHAIVAGAPVTITNQVTHVRMETSTDDRGFYTFSTVEPGRYVVEARAQGYWSTLGPGGITGQSTGAYLGHLGEPRLVTASMRIDF